MMMLQYSTPLQSSTTFQSCLGTSGKGRAVAAGSMLSPSPGSCMLAPSEKSHLPVPFSTAAGWCAGAEQPGAAANVGSKVGDALVSLRELHIPSCGVDACGKERDCRPPDQSSWGTMYHPGGAPPPPGTPPQPLQQHKAPADVGGSSVHMGRLVNTRVRHASAATALPGLAPAGTMTQGNTHESGVKQFSGPYNRTSHPPHDVHSRKRRQGVNSNGGGDAESESAVSGGHAAEDHSVRMHAQVRQPCKHPRGGSTRFDSLGDRREVRGREAKERQGGPAGAVGLPAPEPTCAESFTGWARQDVSCQRQSSPPPPPDDSSAAPQHTSTDSSCRQVMLPSSSSTNSQTSAERGGGGRSWRGLSPGSGAPPPPPPHAMKAVLRACYSDQILDNSRGLPCFKRLKAAFVSVAEVAGHPDLIVPRYLNLARRVPHFPLHRSRPHQSAPLPPPAAPGCAAPAGAAVEDRRGCPAPQGEHTGTPSRDAHGAVTTAANGHGSSNGRSGAGAATVVGGWRAQGVAGGRSCTSAESLSPHPPPSVADTKQPPWLSRNADPGRQQMIQEEMSEVSSVDSDDDEMEDGEVAEEAARVETHQQQHVDVRDSRVFRTDTTPSGDTSTPTMPARIPPWVSTPGAGVAHALRPSAQQQQSHAAVFDSRSDGPPHAEQQSASVPDSREGHQQESEEASPFQCGPPVASYGGSTLLKRPKPYLSETAGAGPCAADGGLPSGCPSVQHFPCAGELKSEQVPSRTANVADLLENKPYPGPRGIESAAAGASGLQHERSSSSCPSIAQQPEALTEATLSQPSATSHLNVPSSRKCAGGHTANHVMQPSVEGVKFQAAAGGSSSSHQDSCPRPKTYVAAGSSSEGAVAKPRPMDPRLTRQPKLQTAQHGRSSSGGILQDVRNATVSGAADNVDANASSVGKVEAFIERKILPDSVAASVQPGTTSTVTSSCSSSSSSGSKTDSASAASTETRADPSRYYVCSIDGSRVELKPPQAPAAGTLPESLAGTCIARGKLPLLLDLDNTLLHAQAAAVTGCDVRLQDWLDENGEPELFRFELSCNRKSYYMKLRPYLRTFLRVLEPYYEMSVYTNATQEYADIVVAILDENRQLFSDRIVARNSGFRGEASENKAVRRMYENMDKRCIVAFDDRQNIWTDLPLSHVVKAQHYDFFDSHRAELNAYYPPLPTIGSSGCGLQGVDALGRMSDEVGIGGELALPDENQQQQGKLQQGKSDQQMLKSSTSGRKPCDWDKHLDCMLKLFLHIHTEFFRDPLNANIGAILSSVQQGVLSGVGIFFTGYRKTYSPGAAVADCEERQAELAQRLGAKVYKRFDEEGVTHVVAGKNNTNNMLACRENTKLSRVHTLWLYCCEAALTRVPETAFEADALCAYYENSPPTSPYRDHWIHLAQKDDSTKEEKVGASSSKTEIPTSTDTGASWLSAAHQHHPLPPQDSLPVREFLGTGPYSDGATLTSPYEEIVFIWRPDKQTVRQLYGEDTRGAAAPSATGTLNTGAPFGSLSPDTGVLLAPVKRGLAGGTSNTLSGTNPLGPTDTRTGFFGESPVEASVFTPSLHAAHDEGLLETKRIGVLAHGTCSQMQLGLPYE